METIVTLHFFVGSEFNIYFWKYFLSAIDNINYWVISILIVAHNAQKQENSFRTKE